RGRCRRPRSAPSDPASWHPVPAEDTSPDRCRSPRLSRALAYAPPREECTAESMGQALGSLPLSLIPTFAVPSWTICHIVSLLQLARASDTVSLREASLATPSI